MLSTDGRSHDPRLRKRDVKVTWKVSEGGLYGSGRKSHGGSSRCREKCSTDKLNGKGHKCERIVWRAMPRRCAPLRSARLGAQLTEPRVLHTNGNKLNVLAKKEMKEGR